LSSTYFDFEVKELKVGGGDALFTDSGETIDSIDLFYCFLINYEHLESKDLFMFTTLLNFSFGV